MVVQVQRHSFSAGTGGPFSVSARKVPAPEGAPTGIVTPLAVGLGTLQAAHALASHRLPGAAEGWYGPNI